MYFFLLAISLYRIHNTVLPYTSLSVDSNLYKRAVRPFYIKQTLVKFALANTRSIWILVPSATCAQLFKYNHFAREKHFFRALVENPRARRGPFYRRDTVTQGI